MNNIEIIDTNPSNISEYGLFCIKNPRHKGYQRKLDWLQQRFSKGLKLKILYSPSEGAVGFIEYIPGEYAWRAVDANGYMVIHCIWVSHKKYQRKGYASLLLEECIKDAKKENKYGVVMVTSGGPWLASKELFLKNGFESVDQAPPSFELLAKKLQNGPLPTFKKDWEIKLNKYSSGLTIIYANQCPYITYSVKAIKEASQELGIKINQIELTNCEETQNAPSAYGVFSLICNGKLLSYHYISKRRFTNIINKELKGE